MIIKIISRTEEEFERCEYRQAIKIEVDGRGIFEVHDGELEDSNLSRDFADCWKIPELMQMAYDAGKKGETFEIIKEENEEI
jgi:hypothetical protein